MDLAIERDGNFATIVSGSVSAGTVTSTTGIMGPTTVVDSTFSIQDGRDHTSNLNFQINGSPNAVVDVVLTPAASRTYTVPDRSGTFIVEDQGTSQVWINQATTANSSSAGVQTSGVTANSAQYGSNQYGNNNGVPGISTFKSRAATSGASSLAPVQVGDVIYRSTSVGVTDNLSIPLSAMISVNVTAVPAGQGYIGTEYELQLVSVDGPANGRRPVFKLSSEGVPRYLESTSPGSHTSVPSGVVALDGTGNAVVANVHIPANARLMLTAQPGPALTGRLQCTAIVANTSFTITSSAGAGDTGVIVYYQIYVPL